MTVSYASQRNSASKGAPTALPKVVSQTITPYTRPSDWLTMPSLSFPTDDTVVCLAAVFPTGPNLVAVQATVNTGTYTVDWGDGTSPQTYASGSVATYGIDYSAISPTTDTTRGYRQAFVTITATTGLLITVELGPNIPAVPSLGYYASSTPVAGRPFLDISMSLPNATSAPSISGAEMAYLEVVSFYGIKSTVVNLSNLFNNCGLLQSVPVLNVPVGTNNIAGMFSGCTKLVSAPNITGITAASVNSSSMFNNCYDLLYVPDYTFKISTAVSMFTNCYCLITAPTLDLSVCTGTSTMFQNCYSLEQVPQLNTSSSLTNANNMFNGCSSLLSVPYFVTSNVTDFSNVFRNCRALVDIPVYDTGNAVTTSGTFQNCYALTSPPLLNTQKVTDMSGMFQWCYSLETIPAYNTSNVVTLTTFVGQCGSLVEFPLIDTSKVSNMYQMFYQCTSLKTLPLLDTGNVTNMYQTFYLCQSLESLPALNTSNNSNLASTFHSCYSLIDLPTLDTSKVPNLYLTFYQCYSLPTFNFIDTSNVVNFQGAFSQMTALRELPDLNTSKGTNFTSFLIGDVALQKIPDTMNFANGITSGSQFMNSCKSLQEVPAMDLGKFITTLDFSNSNNLEWVDASNVRIATNFSSCKLNGDALENFFLNGIVGNASTKAITITSNPGADAAIAKTAGITANSNVITMASTTGIVAGMYVYGTGLQSGIPVTLTNTGDTVAYTNALTNTPVSNDNRVMFTSLSGPLGPGLSTMYYVVNATSTGFQISTTLGGAPFAITTNGTGTMTIGAPRGTTFPAQITTVNSGNIIISGVSGLTNASASLTIRYLNTTMASVQNFTITG